MHLWDMHSADYVDDKNDMPLAVMTDIEGIQRARSLLRGGDTEWETGMRNAMAFLDTVLAIRKRHLAALILRMHGSEYETREDPSHIRR